MPFQFGKVTLTAGVSIPLDMGGQGLSGIVIGNESGLTLTVELQGANSKSTIYPGTVDFIATPIGRNWNGNLIITPSSDLGNVNFWPGSYAYIDVYGSGESPKGSYPLSLNRAGNIGNQVTLVSGSSTSVQNDNNAAGTTVVEATTLGSPSSNVQIYNDGSGWLGRWVNPTFTKICQWFSAGTTAIQLAATGLLTEVLGNLKVDGTSELVGNTTVDGTLSVTGNTTISTLTTSGVATLGGVTNTGSETIAGTLSVTGTASFNGNGASIDASNNFNGNQVDVTTVNASAVNVTTVNAGAVNAGNNHLDGTKLTFLTGSLKRVAKSTGSATATITHNWGEQADIVLAYYNGSFGSPPTQAIAIANEDANSFKVVAQTGYSWSVLYLKF